MSNFIKGPNAPLNVGLSGPTDTDKVWSAWEPLYFPPDILSNDCQIAYESFSHTSKHLSGLNIWPHQTVTLTSSGILDECQIRDLLCLYRASGGGAVAVILPTEVVERGTATTNLYHLDDPLTIQLSHSPYLVADSNNIQVELDADGQPAQFVSIWGEMGSLKATQAVVRDGFDYQNRVELQNNNFAALVALAKGYKVNKSITGLMVAGSVTQALYLYDTRGNFTVLVTSGSLNNRNVIDINGRYGFYSRGAIVRLVDILDINLVSRNVTLSGHTVRAVAPYNLFGLEGFVVGTTNGGNTVSYLEYHNVRGGYGLLKNNSLRIGGEITALWAENESVYIATKQTSGVVILLWNQASRTLEPLVSVSGTEDYKASSFFIHQNHLKVWLFPTTTPNSVRVFDCFTQETLIGPATSISSNNATTSGGWTTFGPTVTINNTNIFIYYLSIGIQGQQTIRQLNTSSINGRGISAVDGLLTIAGSGLQSFYVKYAGLEHRPNLRLLRYSDYKPYPNPLTEIRNTSLDAPILRGNTAATYELPNLSSNSLGIFGVVQRGTDSYAVELVRGDTVRQYYPRLHKLDETTSSSLSNYQIAYPNTALSGRGITTIGGVDYWLWSNLQLRITEDYLDEKIINRQAQQQAFWNQLMSVYRYTNYDVPIQFDYNPRNWQELYLPRAEVAAIELTSDLNVDTSEITLPMVGGDVQSAEVFFGGSEEISQLMQAADWNQGHVQVYSLVQPLTDIQPVQCFNRFLIESDWYRTDAGFGETFTVGFSPFEFERIYGPITGIAPYSAFSPNFPPPFDSGSGWQRGIVVYCHTINGTPTAVRGLYGGGGGATFLFERFVTARIFQLDSQGNFNPCQIYPNVENLIDYSYLPAQNNAPWDGET